MEQAAAVAQRVLAMTTAEPVAIDDDLIPVRASIGVACAESGFPAALGSPDPRRHLPGPVHPGRRTHRTALVDQPGGIAALRALREHGIHIAIDHIGTGCCSCHASPVVPSTSSRSTAI